jgi:hypothetical protein
MPSCIAVLVHYLVRPPQVAFFKSDPMSGAIVASHSPVHQVKVASTTASIRNMRACILVCSRLINSQSLD